jgi:hypothetical protein
VSVSGLARWRRHPGYYVRSKSLYAAKALANIIDDVVVEEDGRVRNREDGRIVVVAAQTLLTSAYGKPPDYDPREDHIRFKLTPVLSDEQRSVLLAMLRAGPLKDATGNSEPGRRIDIESD